MKDIMEFSSIEGFNLALISISSILFLRVKHRSIFLASFLEPICIMFSLFQLWSSYFEGESKTVFPPSLCGFEIHPAHLLTELFLIQPQQTQNVTGTSLQRRCNVITLCRWNVTTLWRRCVFAWTLLFVV